MYDDAEHFIGRRQRIPPPQIERAIGEVVEYIDLSDDNKEKNTKKSGTLQEMNRSNIPDLQQCLQTKQEENEVLRITVSKLNKRIGTEIIDDGADNDDEGSGSSLVVIPRYKKPIHSTQHYQLDAEFGKKIYYLTKVRKKLTFNTIYKLSSSFISFQAIDYTSMEV